MGRQRKGEERVRFTFIRGSHSGRVFLVVMVERRKKEIHPAGKGGEQAAIPDQWLRNLHSHQLQSICLHAGGMPNKKGITTKTAVGKIYNILRTREAQTSPTNSLLLRSMMERVYLKWIVLVSEFRNHVHSTLSVTSAMKIVIY